MDRLDILRQSVTDQRRAREAEERTMALELGSATVTSWWEEGQPLVGPAADALAAALVEIPMEENPVKLETVKMDSVVDDQ